MLASNETFHSWLAGWFVMLQLQGMPRLNDTDRGEAAAASTAPSADSDGTDRATHHSCHFALVALQYGNPWRPTLAVMTGDWTSSAMKDVAVVDKVDADGRRSREAAPLLPDPLTQRRQFACDVSSNGSPALATVWEWLDNIVNLELEWWLKIWIVCNREVAVPQIANAVWAAPDKTVAICLWQPLLQEAAR